jgi:hypothetical protein
MVFGLGAIANLVVRTRKYEKALEQVDALIGRLEEENAKSPLGGLSGIELVDSTVVFLDATLDLRMRDAKGEKKLKLIKSYLEKIEEVYLMNKKILEDTPATRKEILALGLAIRHIAVALDQEFTSLNSLKTLVDAELKNVQAVTARNEKAFQDLQSRLSNEITNIRRDHDQQLALQKKAQGATRVLAYVGISVGFLAALFEALRFFSFLQ